jgi:hypothetical protein
MITAGGWAVGGWLDCDHRLGLLLRLVVQLADRGDSKVEPPSMGPLALD